MIRIAIIGAAGYTAGELIRILVNHPEATIVWAHSNSNAGKPITDIHEGLYGDIDLCFTDTVDFTGIDLLFLCSAHGDSCKFLESHQVPEQVKIIDLAQDFRDESHGFVYGLPELNRERIKGTSRVANPGCFATAIQLALLPAQAAGIIEGDIHVTAITGSTGAGVKPTSKTHFSWRSDNISTYKEFTHQHLLEISRNLSIIAYEHDKATPTINFVPVRGDFARGIFASVYFDSKLEESAIAKLYHDFYDGAAFTHAVDFPLDLKQVVNTNKALVNVTKHGDKVHVVSIIDNLLKGASGQAVQNMNLIFGLDEVTGLRLKASAF
ncbi:MAG: N-acetyl-gamma-glutamyl-phosphate reductase [Clostridiales bacterium]|nr:N-acetyl-gamma-glutamyl-phosphate reductase [Clostridiales bacterium]